MARASRHAIPHTFEELGKYQQQRVEAILHVYYHPGFAQTHWEPEEPPEIEVETFTIVEFNDKRAKDISPGWLNFLREIIQNQIDNSESLRNEIENRICHR